MNQAEIISTSWKLQHLMLTHDRAVQQMNLLDIKMHDMERRIAKIDSQLFPALRSHLCCRISLMEWVHDMYDEYRLRKWTEIQILINYIFAVFTPNDVMSILILANITAQSIGVFIENEEDEEEFEDGLIDRNNNEIADDISDEDLSIQMVERQVNEIRLHGDHYHVNQIPVFDASQDIDTMNIHDYDDASSNTSNNEGQITSL